MDFKGVGWRVLGWIDLAQVMDRWLVHADALRHLWVP